MKRLCSLLFFAAILLVATSWLSPARAIKLTFSVSSEVAGHNGKIVKVSLQELDAKGETIGKPYQKNTRIAGKPVIFNVAKGKYWQVLAETDRWKREYFYQLLSSREKPVSEKPVNNNLNMTVFLKLWEQERRYD